MPKISIIVPVYKVVSTLRKCIDSIINQTFTDFELLLIDDGSPDESGVICDEYLDVDTRILVFHKENGGVSSARNIGLEKAKGEWITFIDSDDTVSPSYLEDLLGGVETTNISLVIQGFSKCLQNGKLVSNYLFKDKVISKTEFGELLFIVGNPFSKLFNRSIIRTNNIYFQSQIHYCEDLIFLMEYFKKCNSIRLLSGSNYNYQICQNDSLSSRCHSLDSEVESFRLVYYHGLDLAKVFKINNSDLLKWKINLFEFVFRIARFMYEQPVCVNRKQRIQILYRLMNSGGKDVLRKKIQLSKSPQIILLFISINLFDLYRILIRYKSQLLSFKI